MSINLLDGFNKDIVSQIDVLEQILKKSKAIYTVIERAPELNLDQYYIGAGCITQTVWNYLCGNDLLYGINDVDFVYFDDQHLEYEAEDEVIRKVHELFADLGLEVDVKNEARVHLWHKQHFGYEIPPYRSLEEAITVWPTTATAVGVRLEEGRLRVFAPYGLNDMFGITVRPNKGEITRQVYENKVDKWLRKWPDLKVIEWD